MGLVVSRLRKSFPNKNRQDIINIFPLKSLVPWLILRMDKRSIILILTIFICLMIFILSVKVYDSVNKDNTISPLSIRRNSPKYKAETITHSSRKTMVCKNFRSAHAFLVEPEVIGFKPTEFRDGHKFSISRRTCGKIREQSPFLSWEGHSTIFYVFDQHKFVSAK